ncbi:MAG: DUF485 domain-containing protein [Ignavibacteria bacterium]|nr:DUF485 domain-containing protein [Ignavibacteria bacterium]
MLHKNFVEFEKDKSIKVKTKLGLILFFIYLVIYSGFVFLGTFYPKSLGAKVLFGLNLAYIYGMCLIVLAGLMGLIYNFLCTGFENKLNSKEGEV